MKNSNWFGWIACSVVVCALPGTAAAQTTRRVPQDFATIQAAINASANGDTVLVSAGTYTENISFKGKAITVRSVSGADMTIIDGGQLASVVTFTSGEGPSSTLTGFTIRNGNGQFASQYQGSGIAISNASPTVTFNRVVDNVGCDGLGIAVGFGSPLIQGNTIGNNLRTSCSGGSGGGGVLVGGASMLQILGNVITGNNSGDGGGGGISLNAAGSTTIRSNIIIGNTVGGIRGRNDTSGVQIIQNLITGNTAGTGGGIEIDNTVSLILNNTIAGNGGGSAFFGWFFTTTGPMTVSNNLIIGNAGKSALGCRGFDTVSPPVFSFNDVFSAGGPSYGNICIDQTGKNGNISADPAFVDPVNANYHLQATSPSIDAGNNSAPNLPPKDIDGDNRIINATGKPVAIVDMGVDEFSNAQVLVLSTSSLAFGLQPPGTSSVAQSVLFTNHGSTMANINAVMAAGDFSQTNTCGASLGAGANCSVSITFTPSMLGPRNGALAIMTDASESPQVVVLSGTGGPAPPMLVVVPH